MTNGSTSTSRPLVATLQALLLLAAGCGTGGRRPTAADAALAPMTVSVEPVAGKLVLDPKWKAGDRVVYEVVKRRQRVRTNGRSVDMTSRTPLTIEVREASDDAYLLACTYGETNLDDPTKAESRMVKQLLDVFRDQTLLVEVQWPGIIAGVRNWEEVKANVTKATDMMIAELERSGTDEQVVRTTRDAIAKMMASREQITQSATRELAILLLPVGQDLDGAKAIELADSLPNPFGGPPIPSKARLELVGVSAAPQTAVVSWTQTVDPAAASRAIESSLREMAARMGRPIPEGEPLPTFDMRDAAEYRVDVATGWPVEFTHTRTVVSGADSQVDTTTMRRTEPKR